MTRLSNLQYPMMKSFVNLRGGYMSIEEAHAFDQRPFRSMLIQRWVGYHHGEDRGFYLTKAGEAAWQEFQDTQIFRKHPELPLTAYFDAVAYGLKNGKRRTHANGRT